MDSKKGIAYLKLFFLLGIPLVLLILPATFFDQGQDLCLSRILLDKECIGCGMTRGMMHLIHLDFSEALYYNSLSFIVFPILAIIWGKWILENVKIVAA